MTRARENGRRWVGLTHFWGPLRRRVRVHSEGPIVRLPRWPRTPFLPSVLPSFLPSFLPRGALSRLLGDYSFTHSPNCRIDHSRSPRGRPERSSRGSGTADRLTRRPVARLHIRQHRRHFRPSVCSSGRFYDSLPLAQGVATTRCWSRDPLRRHGHPRRRSQRRSAPLWSAAVGNG